jgi:HAD superfamily hydrolase (TIGR01484 family)
MEYKAIICDVDGTLIQNSRDALPSQYLKETIHKARQKVHIGIATARPYLFVKKVIEEIELSSPCILCNGVQIYDPVAHKVLVEHLLPTDHLKQVDEILSKLGVECIVQETENRIPFSSSYQPHNPLYIFVPSFPEELTDSFLDAMSDIPNLIVHKMVAWEKGKFSYFICNHAATKQHAILEVAKILGIKTDEIIGVGDGYNDFPLLMACGLKVAMGNAVDDLKAIADYIAPTVEEDGVADVINRFILNPKG